MKIFFVIAAFVFSTCSTLAYAGEVNNYPGSLCEPYINSQNSTSYYPGTSGALVNTSETAVLKVVCPIVLNTENASVISDVTVNVIDGHRSKDVKCSLRAGSSDSPFLYYGSTRSTAGNSSNVQTLSFSDVPLTFSGNDKAMAIMHCEFPEKDNYYVSYIRSYSAGVR